MPRQSGHTDTVTASNYREFLAALKQIIASGTEVAAIHVEEYPAKNLEAGVAGRCAAPCSMTPSEPTPWRTSTMRSGASSGLPAVSVAITYKRNTTELQRIRRAADTEQAKRIIAQCSGGL